jgi:GNAT superfamily N-acetyltransferase
MFKTSPTHRVVRRYLFACLRTAASQVEELVTPEQKKQGVALEASVFGPKPDITHHRMFGIYEKGALVAMTRVNLQPLDKWRKDEAYTELEALKPQVWISATAVDPNYRGRGFASLLREHLKKKYRSILTSSGRKSDPSIKYLNQKQGFREVLSRPYVTVYHWQG